MKEDKALAPLFLVKQDDGKIIGIEIEGLDTTKPLVLALSPDQEYHNGPIFAAILEYLASQGAEVHVMSGDYLRRYTFQLEQGKFTIDTAIEEAADRLTTAWQKVNLGGIKTKPIVDEMKEKGRFYFHGWKKWLLEEPYASQIKALLQDVDCAYAEQDGFYNAINEATENFFSVLCEKHRNNPLFMELLKEGSSAGEKMDGRTEDGLGTEEIKKIIRRYIFEECAVFLLWQSLGYTQMAYPISYHGNGKGTTNQKVFNCVTAIFQKCYPERDPQQGMRLLNIKITQSSPKKAKKLTPSQPLFSGSSRRGSLDANFPPDSILNQEVSELRGMLQEEKRSTYELREEKQRWRQENGGLRHENSDLRQENGGLRHENSDLRHENSDLRHENSGLRQELRELRKKVPLTQHVSERRHVPHNHMLLHPQPRHSSPYLGKERRDDDLTSPERRSSSPSLSIPWTIQGGRRWP